MVALSGIRMPFEDTALAMAPAILMVSCFAIAIALALINGSAPLRWAVLSLLLSGCALFMAVAGFFGDYLYLFR